MPAPGADTGGDDQLRSAQVSVKPVGKRSRIRVDVDPDDVAGQWRLMVHKKTTKGWKKVNRVVVVEGKKVKRVKAGKLTTSGSKNRLVIDPKKGTYRITVKPGHGYSATTSTPTTIRR